MHGVYVGNSPCQGTEKFNDLSGLSSYRVFVDTYMNTSGERESKNIELPGLFVYRVTGLYVDNSTSGGETIDRVIGVIALSGLLVIGVIELQGFYYIKLPVQFPICNFFIYLLLCYLIELIIKILLIIFRSI